MLGAPGYSTGDVLEKFAVEGGSVMVVPVRFGAGNHLFQVDTGVTLTVLNSSLSLGDPVRTATAVGEGVIDVKLYRSPALAVGRIKFGPGDLVVGADLSWLRRAFGIPVDGVLGMDFLREHIVHMDPDKRTLSFLRVVPNNPGVPVPIEWDPDLHLPYVEATVAAGVKASFLVDTGCVAFDSGGMQSDGMRELVRRGEFRALASGTTQSLTGKTRTGIFRGGLLEIGGFRVDRPLLRESNGSSKLGIGFLRRFAVTLDFPRSKMYLRKGKDFGRADTWNASGLGLESKGGHVEASSVAINTPAKRAGIKPGDVVLEINGLGRTA